MEEISLYKQKRNENIRKNLVELATLLQKEGFGESTPCQNIMKLLARLGTGEYTYQTLERCKLEEETKNKVFTHPSPIPSPSRLTSRFSTTSNQLLLAVVMSKA